jgi:hypothetical protein
MSTVNDQITDSITQLNALLTGGAAAQSMGMLDITGTETLGMSMFNAITKIRGHIAFRHKRRWHKKIKFK